MTKHNSTPGVEGTAPVQPKRYRWDQETDDTFGFMVGPVPDGEWVKWADVAHVYGVAPTAPAKPVAWVDVKDSYEGPYTFHGLELLPVGKHHLYVAPVSMDVPRGGDALGALEAALEWHRGDKWRVGTPAETETWRAHRERLEAAIEALRAGVLGTQGGQSNG